MVTFWYLWISEECGLCALRHGIQISMEAILACHPARSTEWLDCHPINLMQNCANYDVFAQAPLYMSMHCVLTWFLSDPEVWKWNQYLRWPYNCTSFQGHCVMSISTWHQWKHSAPHLLKLPPVSSLMLHTGRLGGLHLHLHIFAMFITRKVVKSLYIKFVIEIKSACITNFVFQIAKCILCTNLQTCEKEAASCSIKTS